MKPSRLLQRPDRVLDRLARYLLRSIGNSAYYWLAAAFSLAVIADFTLFQQVRLMEFRMFDALVSHRLNPAPADPEIVIVDIDEASLNAMAADYGRWPWPRQVLGEWVEGIEWQKPKAIVFDMLFSDADVLNPASEAYFNAAIAATDNTFFPMLRLGAQNDALSQIRPSMLPWLTPIQGQAQDDSPIAVVLPKFQAAIDGARIGTHQVVPDRDSVIRRYRLFAEHGGWRISSLPEKIGAALGFKAPLPERQDFLINWRGKEFSYKYVSFNDIFADLLRKNRQRPADEFSGKIVILGSTAPSLFDIKSSPTARIFPGVEILATAIDNLKNGDALRELHPGFMLVVTLLFIWSMAAALTRHIAVSLFDQLFAVSQIALIGLGYLTLNLSLYYIDMSAPVTFSLLYFTLARAYTSLSEGWLANQKLVGDKRPADGEYSMQVLAIATEATTVRERRALLGEINRLVINSDGGARRIGRLIEDTGMVREMFGGTVLVYWLNEVGDNAAQAAANEDAERIRTSLAKSLAGLNPHFTLHGGNISFSSAGNWQVAGKRIIIESLERVTANVAGPPAPSQASLQSDNR